MGLIQLPTQKINSLSVTCGYWIDHVRPAPAQRCVSVWHLPVICFRPRRNYTPSQRQFWCHSFHRCRGHGVHWNRSVTEVAVKILAFAGFSWYAMCCFGILAFTLGLCTPLLMPRHLMPARSSGCPSWFSHCANSWGCVAPKYPKKRVNRCRWACGSSITLVIASPKGSAIDVSRWCIPYPSQSRRTPFLGVIWKGSVCLLLSVVARVNWMHAAHFFTVRDAQRHLWCVHRWSVLTRLPNTNGLE